MNSFSHSSTGMPEGYVRATFVNQVAIYTHPYCETMMNIAETHFTHSYVSYYNTNTNK